jgi:multiple sugar transport system ATP-binding protein
MNLFDGRIAQAGPDGLTLRLDNGTTVHALVDGSAARAGDRITLGLRAEHADLAVPDPGAPGVFTGQVSMVEHLGEANAIYVTLTGGQDVVIRGPGDQRVQLGAPIAFSAPAAVFHVFDAQGQALRRLQPGNLVSARQSQSVDSNAAAGGVR